MKRPEKNKLLELKFFDYTVLHYQTILETAVKILNFTQSHFFRICQDLFCNRKFNKTRLLCLIDIVDSLVFDL